MTKRALLIIMDGWGWREDTDGNAVRLARTPNVDRLWESYPHTLINGSGHYVGLPDGQMGNSEVGHLNLGAGRVVYQDIVRIDRAIEDKSFFANPALNDCMEASRNGGALHLLGLLSDGGVHSHEEHLYALVRMARQKGIERLYIHAILDGRDTPPHKGVEYLRRLQKVLKETGLGVIASVVGRYTIMDRDKRWERTKTGYDLLTGGVGAAHSDPVKAVAKSYDDGVTDEFVHPIVVVDAQGAPRGLVRDGDSVIFYNFRADRARQITHAFVDDKCDGFERERKLRLHFTCMTRYEGSFDLPVAFAPVSRKNTLAEVAASAGKRTLRIAETEKYAHVTYFFNGGIEEKWEGETRILVPSPKVATYDLQPEMSAAGVADALIKEIERDAHDYIICNFANPDMVGHTGVLEAAITACETVDSCVGRVLQKIDLERYAVIVTADHGNCEQMFDYETGGAHTAHTTNPVPCILVDPDYTGRLIEDGALKDIAPTICNYLGLKLPEEMDGLDLRCDVVR